MMRLPAWPVIWVDVIGSAATLVLAGLCIHYALLWSRQKTSDSFRHYLFMLTLATGVFAISRSVGHLVKQALVHMDQTAAWLTLAPYSGAVNTMTFVVIFAFSLYFNRVHKLNLQAQQAAAELRNAEAKTLAAHESEKLFRTVFDGMEDLIYVIDEHHAIRFFNRKVLELFPNISVGAQCCKVFQDAGNICIHCHLESVVSADEVTTREVHLTRTDTFLSLLEIPLIWLDGSKAKLNVGRDISESKKMEEQLRHAQKMEAIGTLAGGVAHDMNNTLTPVLGYAELAMMKMAPDDPLLPDLIEIKNGAQRATELVGRILAFSRRKPMRMLPVDVNSLTSNIEKMLRSLLEENIQIELAPTPGIWTVSADPGQLEQVFVNLAVNARDAMPDGGMLRITTENVTDPETACLSCSKSIEGRQVLMTVADNGTGINKEHLQRIFEPYFTTKPHGKGTGLGLAMIDGIVHQHNGHLTLHSEPGKGTTFHVYLPAMPPQTVLPPGPEPPKASEAGHETILVVEDSKEVRDVAVHFLSRLGYSVLEAENAEAALRCFKEAASRIDLLLTDVIMPGMNGWELAMQLQQAQPDLRILFMSGYPQERIGHHDILDSGVSLLAKPFTIESLGAKVRAALAT